MNNTELKPCPICKAKAFIHHDKFEGYDLGWSVGCPRACIADGVHGFNDRESFRAARLVMHGFTTKETAEKTWNRRASE